LTALHAVLARDHLKARLELQNSSVEQALSRHAAMTVTVSPIAVPRVVAADPDDDHVVATAVAANAVLIVSGNRHRLDLTSRRGIRIVSPVDALRLIAASCCRWHCYQPMLCSAR